MVTDAAACLILAELAGQLRHAIIQVRQATFLREEAVITSGSPVRMAVNAAVRRRNLILAAEHSAIAFAAVFGGIVLLLLLGTQILNWPWIVLLGALGTAAGFFRLRRHLVSRYSVAQMVDRRLQLSDALSTAWFLLEQPGQHVEQLASSQIARAEAVARAVRPASVFPFVWRRAWTLAAALGAVAFGLFALRYLVTDSLDLRQALIPMRIPALADVLERLGVPDKQLARRSNPNPHAIPYVPGAVTKDAGQPTGDKAPASDRKSPFASKDEAAARPPEAGAQTGGQNGKSGTDNGKMHPDGASEMASAKSPQNQAAQSGESKNAEKNGSDRKPDAGLMDRMKEALSGLMAKMHPQGATAKGSGTQRSQEEAKQGQANGKNTQQNLNTQQNASNAPKTQSQSRDQNGQGQQTAQAAEKSPGSQSHASDESTDRKSSDAHSGIGRQDGEKSLKEADQLKAMGKLDEIIGKRSAALTGDMTIETRSNHQQLQTQYSGQLGQHSDSGIEIDRNEVPIALQPYVREYMEQVRKQANGHN